jgi:hypothetical protein
MATKTCNKCNTEKTLENFYHRENRNRYESTCKPCVNEMVRIKRSTNPEFKKKADEVARKSRHNNRDKLLQQQHRYYEENKDKLKQNMKQAYQDNKEDRILYAKTHRQEIKVKVENGLIDKPNITEKKCTKCNTIKQISESTFRKVGNGYEPTCKACNVLRERARRAANKNVINARRREIQKPKNINQKLVNSLRGRLNKLVKNREKKNLYSDLLGCDISFLIKWFEYIFKLDSHLNMSWSNYGILWQIDHVTPCAAYDLTLKENQQKCFHWTNLCPVLKSYNLSKQDKIIHVDIVQQKARVDDFRKIQGDESEET